MKNKQNFLENLNKSFETILKTNKKVENNYKTFTQNLDKDTSSDFKKQICIVCYKVLFQKFYEDFMKINKPIPSSVANSGIYLSFKEWQSELGINAKAMVSFIAQLSNLEIKDTERIEAHLFAEFKI